jgi:hypothetical protein
MILMRSDGKPLHHAHAVAIVNYCTSIMIGVKRDQPLAGSISDEMQAQLDVASMEKEGRHLLEHASEEGLRHYWEHSILTPSNVRYKDLPGVNSPIGI